MRRWPMIELIIPFVGDRLQRRKSVLLEEVLEVLVSRQKRWSLYDLRTEEQAPVRHFTVFHDAERRYLLHKCGYEFGFILILTIVDGATQSTQDDVRQ